MVLKITYNIITYPNNDCLLAIGLHACKTYENRALQEEESSYLETIALSNESPESKYHSLGKEIVTLLEGALANDTDSAMLADMRVFVKKHDYSIKYWNFVACFTTD